MQRRAGVIPFSMLSVVAAAAASADQTFVGSDNQLIVVGDRIVRDEGSGGPSTGQVVRFDSGGKAVVLFKGGVRKHLGSKDIRILPKFSVGDEVTWPAADKGISKKTVGRIVRFDSRNYTVVTFGGTRRRVHPVELRRVLKFQVGDEVVWEVHKGDKDVAPGAGGTIIRYDSKGLAVVKFKGGVKRHVLPPELRRAPKLAIGDDVTWPGADAEIGRAAMGQVTRFDSKGQAVVKFRGGKKRHVPTASLLLVPKLAVGDTVVWTGDDAQTPRGSIGKIMRFDSTGSALVRFAKGVRRRLPSGELRRPGDAGGGAGKRR